VLLNFLGVEFISQLDDVAFGLGKTGYLGEAYKKAAEEITFKRIKKKRSRAHVFVLLAVFAVLLGNTINIAIRQGKGYYLKKIIQVEFGDETVSLLGTFSGCYQLQNDMKESLINSLVSQRKAVNSHTVTTLPMEMGDGCFLLGEN